MRSNYCHAEFLPSVDEEGRPCRVQHVLCKSAVISSDNLRWVQVILIGEEVSGVSGESKTLESPRDFTDASAALPLVKQRWED